MRMLVMLVVLVAVVVVVYQAVAGSIADSPRSERLKRARQRVRAVSDVAWAHDEISPELAGEVIERVRGLNDDSTAQKLEAALDDVLAIARRHRVDEPDLAVIMIDTVRHEDGPQQLG